MSIFVIGDLHLSFDECNKLTKPMNIFGENWNNHAYKIKSDWISKVNEEDTVVLLGDFSWAMNLENTLNDFKYLNNLPGKKILFKGNHDYWWTTVTNMKKFLKENNLENIDFLHNNAIEIENKIICGTRGWIMPVEDTDNSRKMIERECNRLEISIECGKKLIENSQDKEIICCMHYPPILQSNIAKKETTPFIKILKQYNINKCYYGHLHSSSIKDAVCGNIDGIELKLVSADGLDFKLLQI